MLTLTFLASFPLAGASGEPNDQPGSTGTGAYLPDDLGTDNVTPDRDAIHDQTRQRQGFTLATYPLDSRQKFSLIFSGVDADFPIPNERELPPGFALVLLR